MDAGRSAGIVVGTLDAGGKRRVVAYGAGGPTGSTGVTPLDGNSVLEIGSVTKVFTGTLLASMVARGDVRLDDPVAKYLPATVKVPERGGKQITLLDLATQSSGLPRLPSNLRPKDATNPYADYSEAQMYEFLSGYTLPRDIGSRYEYSNLGMGLLGHALARRAGKSYEALVTERILQPLGMSDTRVTLTPAMRARLTPGHDMAGKPVANWDLPTLAGAGALRSTVNDMLTFLAANVATGAGPLSMVMPQARLSRHPTDNPNLSIGLAWHLLKGPGREIVWHNGGTGGYHSFIAFDPAARTGVVVLSNSSSDIDDIGLHLIEPGIPLQALPKTRGGGGGCRDPRCLRGRVRAGAHLPHRHHEGRGEPLRPGDGPAEVPALRRVADELLPQGGGRASQLRQGREWQGDAARPPPERPALAGAEGEVSGTRPARPSMRPLIPHSWSRTLPLPTFRLGSSREGPQCRH